jgi:integrase
MASVYLRGEKWWCRLKDETGAWISRPTEFAASDKRKAQRYANAAQKKLDERRSGGPGEPMTVAAYGEKWLAGREERGVRSIMADRGRFTNHALPHLGALLLDEVRPRHVRDMVRALREAGDLAPRTIVNIYGVVHTMFRDAVVDELIESNPCVLHRGELPAKVDKDPEWRTSATYIVREVEQLISDARIPPERRVQYALKALAGLRHGEVAGLRWRHYDPTIEPLGRLVIATSYDTGRTKTEVTRRVPVHALLAKILAAWKLSHWERIYGRSPASDDLIVPTRNLTPIAPKDANDAFKRDLAALGLRVEAGEHRDRGGHDLRSWFITTCQEHGAHRDLLRVVTHAGKGDVVSGYTRAQWPALCAEVAKLRVSTLDGEVLALATGFATAELKAANRWRNLVTPKGLEPLFSA